jgi:hypothetical protein
MPVPVTRAVIIRDALVYVTPARIVHGDVVAEDGLLTRVGPGRQPDPADALVLDGRGASVVPILIDGAIRAGGRSAGHELAPGNPAVFAVIRGAVPASIIGEMLMIDPRDMLAVMLEDRLVAWDREIVTPDEPDPAWVGAWTDPSRGMTQFLSADGRYSETRGGLPDAYTGRYWTQRGWIAYLDDAGFWAFGRQSGNVVYHGGFVLRRTAARAAF